MCVCVYYNNENISLQTTQVFQLLGTKKKRDFLTNNLEEND